MIHDEELLYFQLINVFIIIIIITKIFTESKTFQCTRHCYQYVPSLLLNLS
jgi:hypothetical protein